MNTEGDKQEAGEDSAMAERMLVQLALRVIRERRRKDASLVQRGPIERSEVVAVQRPQANAPGHRR